MKKVSYIIVLVIFLAIVSGCSNTTAKQKDTDTDSTDSSSTVNQDSENESPSSITGDESEKGSDTAQNESDSSSIDFDIETYLNENYSIDNTHYETKIWKNDETGRTEFIVNILPETKAFAREVNDVFKNGTPYKDERTKAMFDMAEQIMGDVPEINKQYHIDSVNWVSTIDDFSVMLIQDYENSDLRASDKGDKTTLSQYSSQQIEYARVWMQLGPNQDITDLYVRHIPAGTPLNPEDDIDVSYPEDVIQLTGSRIVDGIVTYSGNGDGTINVYNVPRRWYGGATPPDDMDKEEVRKDLEDIVTNTTLVSIDPGADEEVVEYIKLLQVTD
ncbi:hypothetical protein [Aquibacillus kalidii]|uniref:hypothetical protein n=1 Tax=Aquibacillus kalidii TaxID=2762597 RepID=UPI00164852DF